MRDPRSWCARSRPPRIGTTSGAALVPAALRHSTPPRREGPLARSPRPERTCHAVADETRTILDALTPAMPEVGATAR